MDVLVTYDISTTDSEGQARLARVAKICESYGTRVQYSVFEFRIGPTALERFTTEIIETINPSTDSVHVYRFSGDLAAFRTSIGKQPTRQLGQPWII